MLNTMDYFMVLQGDLLQKVVDELKHGGFVTDTISMGQTKFMVTLIE